MKLATFITVILFLNFIAYVLWTEALLGAPALFDVASFPVIPLAALSTYIKLSAVNHLFDWAELWRKGPK